MCIRDRYCIVCIDAIQPLGSNANKRSFRYIKIHFISVFLRYSRINYSRYWVETQQRDEHRRRTISVVKWSPDVSQWSEDGFCVAGVGYTKFETGALFSRLPTSKKLKYNINRQPSAPKQNGVCCIRIQCWSYHWWFTVFIVLVS